MRKIKPRVVRWSGWLVVAAHVVMTAGGVTLQFLSTKSTYLGFSVQFFIGSSLVVLAWTAIGATIIQRMPRHPIGWIMLLTLVSFAPEMAAFGLLAYFEELPRLPYELARIWLAWSGSPFALLGFTWLFLLFPTGRPLSPRWGRLRWAALAGFAAYLVLAPLSPERLGSLDFGSPLAVSDHTWSRLRPLWWATNAGQFAVLGAAAVSLVIRLRAARGVERQQLKWFAAAAAILPLHLPPLYLGTQAGAHPALIELSVALLLGSVTALAVAVAVAIFRYRLYDIDLIINRALVYGTVSGALLATYLMAVVLLQAGFTLVTGQRSPLAIVAATLFSAALFQPLRYRVQTGIDRRFYRAKYDAHQLIDQMGARLRNEVDPDEISELLLRSVGESLHPAELSLWIKRGGRHPRGRAGQLRSVR